MNTRLNRTVGLAIVFSGFCGLCAQIIFIREFLIIFYGNELSIGFILAAWLFSVATGSYFFSLFSKRITHKITLFSVCLVLLGLLLPVCIILIRLSKVIMNFNPGEIVPLFAVAVAGFAFLFPACVLFGYIFALACSIYQPKSGIAAGKIINVYILEALGSCIAGLIVSAFLVPLFDALEIAVFTSTLSFLCALFLVFLARERFRKFLMFVYVGIIIIFSLFLTTSGITKLNSFLGRLQWRGYEVVASGNSVYANITVAKRGAQTVFFENGLLLSAMPGNREIAEHSIHFTLLEHQNPKNILLIGGGTGGLINEILKYPVGHVDYLEIDPLIIKFSKKYLPEGIKKSLEDKRVSILNVDARFFVKSSGKKYDCIIIHCGSPLTAQSNRYYTADFFTQLKERLNDGGVVSLSLNSSENYINKELRDFLRSIYVSLRESFADVKVIPGNEAYFIASDGGNYATYNYKELLQRLKERNIETKYVREYYLFSVLSKERVSYIENILDGKTKILPNYDFKPAGYFYNLIFWTTYFRDSVFTWLLKAANFVNIWLIFICFVFAVGLAGLTAGRLNFQRRIALFSVFITGFSAMCFQILILFSFQIIYGYLFYKLGFILTAFMSGLALGGYFSRKNMPAGDASEKLKFVQLLLSCFALILPLTVTWLMGAKSFLVNELGENIIFMLLPALCGVLTGMQFAYANKVCLKIEDEPGRLGGLTYALDLLGSCVAAFATAVFFIPVFGVLQTCLFVCGINLVVWIFLSINPGKP
ncbi:MAG: hypothetical protein PHP17_02145 [Candidatus Omnitrophica bacterium]|nr:hypothetical protein [Candidatus Omnitrophota bacterium]